MKVMHIEAGRTFYGGPRQVLYLVEGLARRNIESLVVCPDDSEIATRLRHAEIAVYPMQMSGDLDVGLIKRLRATIEQNQPDIIHLHSRRGADWFGGLAARRFTDIPVVLSRRVDNLESALLSKFKYRLFDRVIVISNAIREVLINIGVSPDKLAVVHDGINPDAWQQRWDRLAFQKTFFDDLAETHKVQENVPIIGMVAQLIKRKGHRYLVEALPEIHRHYPEARVVFFGRGPEKQNLMQQATRLGLQDSIMFAGFRKDINHWLGCLDVFVHPPLAEGLGVAVLQAAAARLPIVASRVGGLPEIIRDGENGFLIEPGDVAGIAARVVALLDDREQATRFGEAALETVANQFSVDAMVEGNLAVYRSLLHSRKANAASS